MRFLRNRRLVASYGGGSAFSPASIAGLQLWLDASQITGLNDGDAVTTWADLSGNGNDATQATGSKKPTFQTNELNGLPIVKFDGVDDFMSATYLLNQPFTRVVVFRNQSVGATHYFNGSPAGGNAAYYGNASLLSVYAGSIINSAVTTPSATYYVGVAVFNGAGSSLRIAGSTVNGAAGSNNAGGITISSYQGTSAFSQIDVAFVADYNVALNSGQITQIEDYLNERFGL